VKNINYFRVIFLLTILTLPIESLSEELTPEKSNSNEKFGQFLGGWGDKLFSIFGNAFEKEQKQRNELLDKLAGEDGELTNDEIYKFLKNESEITAEEDARAIEELKKLYDPDTGMFSGLFKYNKKLNEQTKKQAEKLDEAILSIIDQSNELGPQKSVLRLKMIHWIPIGNQKIDEQMSNQYKKIVNDLILQLNKNF